MTPDIRCTPALPRQRGVALFAVVVFVMLSMLLALWASRTALFHEMIVGNEADYQRAYAAAEALLLDAELDIRGENADGSACTGSGDICRTATVDKMPLEAKDIGPLLAALDQQAATARCRNGLCAKRTGPQDFWNDPTLLQAMARPAVGARYGQFTGAQAGSGDRPANPILADTSAPGQGGWYWIEVLPYDESSRHAGLIADSGSRLLALHLTPSVVYRITALAYGRRPGTLVVLQQTYARNKRKD